MPGRLADILGYSLVSAIRLGAVGLGRAFTSLLPSIDRHPGFELVAVADISSVKRDEFARRRNVHAYPTARDMLASGDVDAVYLGTPHEMHAPDANLAAAHGRHVLVEKPMALALADCDEMTAAADRAGVVLVVGPTHGFDPQVQAMREIIQSGEFGRLRMVSMMNYTDFLYRPRRPEELARTAGGGVLYNQLPHQVDMLRSLDPSDEIDTICAVVGAWDPDRSADGAYIALAQTTAGCIANLVYSGYAHFDSDELVSWWGEEGALKKPGEYGRARALIRDLDPGREAAAKAASAMRWNTTSVASALPHFGIAIASCEHADLVPAPSGVIVYGDEARELRRIDGSARGSKATVLDEFHAAITGRQPVLHDGSWGRATLAVCLAVRDSAACGAAVHPFRPSGLPAERREAS
jgi:phthalate 4,5-cis-dihydrodiol dehydrogenase